MNARTTIRNTSFYHSPFVHSLCCLEDLGHSLVHRLRVLHTHVGVCVCICICLYIYIGRHAVVVEQHAYLEPFQKKTRRLYKHPNGIRPCNRVYPVQMLSRADSSYVCMYQPPFFLFSSSSSLKHVMILSYVYVGGGWRLALLSSSF